MPRSSTARVVFSAVVERVRAAATRMVGRLDAIVRAATTKAHVDAVQNHTRNNHMRNPLAAEVFNEEVANLIKRKLRANPYELEKLTMRFGYEGEVSSADTGEILDRITRLYGRVLEKAESERTEERRQSLLAFAENLQKAFYGFEADFFQQNVSRIVDDVVSQIQGSLKLWPTLVEICYFQKHTRELPKVNVNNTRLKAGG